MGQWSLQGWLLKMGPLQFKSTVGGPDLVLYHLGGKGSWIFGISYPGKGSGLRQFIHSP